MPFNKPIIMNDAFIGSIIMFAGNFAPRGWAFCNGQLLPIQDNQALFSILGTTYGGDGRTTFALPDLRGRAPINAGDGPGLSPRRLGDMAGTETNTLPVVDVQFARAGFFGTVSRPLTGPVQRIPNIQPSCCINFIICLQGTFPSRA